MIRRYNLVITNGNLSWRQCHIRSQQIKLVKYPYLVAVECHNSILYDEEGF